MVPPSSTVKLPPGRVTIPALEPQGYEWKGNRNLQTSGRQTRASSTVGRIFDEAAEVGLPRGCARQIVLADGSGNRAETASRLLTCEDRWGDVEPLCFACCCSSCSRQPSFCTYGTAHFQPRETTDNDPATLCDALSMPQQLPRAYPVWSGPGV